MKLLRSLLTNGWFIFAIALYLAGLFVLSQRPELSVNETLVELAIFGFALRLLASSCVALLLVLNFLWCTDK
jgi:hypothetical protein